MEEGEAGTRVRTEKKGAGRRELLVKKWLDEDRMLSTLFVKPSTLLAGGNKGPRGSTGGRRSKQCRVLYTRLLTQFPALLDDTCPAMALRILERVDKWQFNAFLLDRVTGGHCLPFLCPPLLLKTGLVNHFKMDPSDVMGFFRQIERGYHSGNPYHNALHASDVTQAMYVYCRQAAILPHLKPLELLAALVAAVSHDLDHPGFNEKFLVSTEATWRSSTTTFPFWRITTGDPLSPASLTPVCLSTSRSRSSSSSPTWCASSSSPPTSRGSRSS